MKYHIEKNTVQETLVIPLFARKVCSERYPSLFSDPEAERVCSLLDYDFASREKKMHSAMGLFGALEVAQRQYDLAWEVRNYLSAHPAARLLTMLVAPVLSGACRSEKKRAALKEKLRKKGAIGDGEQALAFADAFIDNMAQLGQKTVSREFYSDYVTPLADDIHADGMTIHVIYALKMGEKYGKRYRRHFRDPDILTFDMKHEAWLYDETWKRPVLDAIFACMEQPA